MLNGIYFAHADSVQRGVSRLAGVHLSTAACYQGLHTVDKEAW